MNIDQPGGDLGGCHDLPPVRRRTDQRRACRDFCDEVTPAAHDVHAVQLALGFGGRRRRHHPIELSAVSAPHQRPRVPSGSVAVEWAN